MLRRGLGVYERGTTYTKLTLVSPQEATTRTVKLSDETDEEVDMLLLHLYTLVTPIFKDSKLFKFRFRAALSALKLGDKYDLPNLSKPGEEFLVECLGSMSQGWQAREAEDKKNGISFFQEVWETECDNLKPVREALIRCLVEMGKGVTECEAFQDFFAENSGFAFAFLLAQTEKLREDHISPYY